MTPTKNIILLGFFCLFVFSFLTTSLSTNGNLFWWYMKYTPGRRSAAPEIPAALVPTHTPGSRGESRVKCLSQGHNSMARAGRESQHFCCEPSTPPRDHAASRESRVKCLSQGHNSTARAGRELTTFLLCAQHPTTRPRCLKGKQT